MRNLKFLSILLLGLTFACTKDKVPADLSLNCADTVKFSTDILPMIQSNCTGCHDVGNGTGYTLTNHTNISSNANAVLGSMRGSGFQLMPKGGPALPDSVIQKVECWMYQGKLNN